MTRRLQRCHLSLVLSGCALACTSEAAGPGSESTGTTGTTGAEPIAGTDPVPTSSGDESSAGTTEEPGTTSVGTTTTSSGPDESTGPAPMCGDGVVQDVAGEECDLGADNRDDGACTLDCKAAVCGDGLVWTGMEACDDAADNGSHYGGCSPTCSENPKCGDGVLDVPFEACDHGENNGIGEGDGMQGPCSIGCTWDGHFAFLSSLVYPGDMLEEGDQSGLEGAHRLCQERAWAAGFQDWDEARAWLSDGLLGPLWYLDEIPARPILLTSGEQIAESLSDLIVNGPGLGIRLDEFGAPLPPSRVWTNTGANGKPASAVDHCEGWSSSGPNLFALVGVSHAPPEPEDEWNQWQAKKYWTSKQMQSCEKVARLYCFVQ